MKIFVAHASSFEYEEKIYKPLRSSVINIEHKIFLPHEDGEDHITKELIKSCDLVIGEVSHPSTGEGIELGWADAYGVPIFCIYEKGSKPPSSVRYLAREVTEYASPEVMLEKINSFISRL